MTARQERERHRLRALEASLRALDPSAVLERGYAVVCQGGRVLGGIANADMNQPIQVALSDGALEARITGITPKDGKP